MSLRPGKSSESTTSALRLGFVLGGTVVAEQVVRDTRPVSIGQSARASFQLPVTGLPRRWELIARTADGLRLRLTPSMDVRIAVGDEVWTRATCDQRGTTRGDVTTVTLPPDAHGRVDLGEVRVLFQGVRVPAAVPPLVLPRALKGTLADRIDTRVAVVAAASLCVHVGLMVAASLNDPPAEPTMARRATETYAEDTLAIIDASDPLLDLAHPAATDEPGPAAATPAAPPAAPTTATRPAAPRPTRPGAPTLTDPDDDATRLADLLFAPDGSAGHLTGDLAARKPGSDLSTQLDEIKRSGATASIGDQSGRRPADTDGVARPGTSQTPLVGPPGDVVTTGKDPESVPPGRIKPVPTPRPPGDPSVDAIIRKIATTYMGGLQRCYKKSLAADPTLSGKVALSFSVTERGALTDGRASGIDDEVAGCIQGLMTKWSFTPVVDGDGDATEVDVKLGLALTPH
ncbi:MAG: AgmX/PglI C-terminal domain-containing protein [Kofleriaceae bacterium]